MGDLPRQVGNELKQLPLMLGKLLGGMMAVAGFGAAVWMATRGPGTPPGNAMLALLVGAGGVVVFVLADRKMAGRATSAGSQPASAERKRMNLLSWGLLLLVVAIFLLCVAIFLR